MDGVVGASIYNKLNEWFVYNRILIQSGYKWKILFDFRYGYFEYQVMAFRVVNNLTNFQGYINFVLRNYWDILCISYLNNILLYSVDPKIHNDPVGSVF